MALSLCLSAEEQLEWASVAGPLPDSPEWHANAVSIHDTLGFTDDSILRTGETIEHPGISILVRSSNKTDGWGRIQQIGAALDAIKHTTVVHEEHTYNFQAASRGPYIHLGPETESQRRPRCFLFTVNAVVTITEVQ